MWDAIFFVAKLIFFLIGNVAWAHVKAKETMKNSPKNIAGLPVFVTGYLGRCFGYLVVVVIVSVVYLLCLLLTDDTPIEDTTKFCQRLSRRTNAFNIRPTSWSIPSLFTHWLLILLEVIVLVLNPIFGTTLSFQPRALSAYAGSLLQYSRLRAELHMNYEPLYNEEIALDESVKWYEKWYNSYFNKNKNATAKKSK